MPLMWGQVQEPHFTGDKIEARLQVSCFLNHFQVVSGLQPFLGLVRLIFVGEKDCFVTFPPPLPWKGPGTTVSSSLQRLSGFVLGDLVSLLTG